MSAVAEIPWVPKKRYRIMGPYMTKVGTLGHRMMKQTATVQANIDYSDEKDAMAKKGWYDLSWNFGPGMAVPEWPGQKNQDFTMTSFHMENTGGNQDFDHFFASIKTCFACSNSDSRTLRT